MDGQLYEGIQYAKSNRYDEAIKIFDILFAAEQSKFQTRELYYYGKCLRKTGRLKESLEIGKRVYDINPDFEANTNQLAWNVYDLFIKSARDGEVHEEDFLQAASFIMSNTKQIVYSPYERTVFEVLKYLKSKPNLNYNTMSHWVGQLDTKLLSREPFPYTDNLGKERELASPLEQWHSYRVKILYGQKQWEACIEAVDEALAAIDGFHYSNHIWIRIKKAVSTAHAGEPHAAINQLEQIVKESGAWTAYYELFKLFLAAGNEPKALESGACALLAKNGEHKHKVQLIGQMGKLHEAIGQSREALLHYHLVREVRTENGWPLNEKLVAMIIRLDPDTRSIERDYLSTLEKVWLSYKLRSLPEASGTIVKIISEGRAGFILTNKKESVFFRANQIQFARNRLTIQQRVNFHIAESFDPKKQRSSREAIAIRLG